MPDSTPIRKLKPSNHQRAALGNEPANSSVAMKESMAKSYDAVVVADGRKRVGRTLKSTKTIESAISESSGQKALNPLNVIEPVMRESFVHTASKQLKSMDALTRETALEKALKPLKVMEPIMRESALQKALMPLNVTVRMGAVEVTVVEPTKAEKRARLAESRIAMEQLTRALSKPGIKEIPSAFPNYVADKKDPTLIVEKIGNTSRRGKFENGVFVEVL